MKAVELFGALLTLLGIGFFGGGPFVYEHVRQGDRERDVDRVITLTGVAKSGVWTEENVTGFNYWRRDFPAARLVVREGETIALVLKSADVTHRFYCPELGVGPIDITPGHVESVRFHARRAGSYPYYCTSRCGDCHFFMRGVIVVLGKHAKGADIQDAAPGTPSICTHETDLAPPPDLRNAAQRGKRIFETKGCVTCHGREAAGGVSNYNYARDTVPALNALGDKMFLEDEEDVEKLISLIESGLDLQHVSPDALNIPRAKLVMAQYRSIYGVIKNGSRAESRDQNAVEPPLHMPMWGLMLTEQDIRDLFVYFLNLQVQAWEEEE